MTAPTTPPDRRARHKQKTRQEIERCAIELFERHGVDATTVEQIAERADISRRTFFRYYRTKEDVLLQPRYGAAEILGQLIADRPTDEPPLVAVRRSTEALNDLLPTDAVSTLRRRSEILMNDPVLRDRGASLIFSWQDAIAAALQHRTSHSDLDPLLLAGIACAALQWATVKWLEDPSVELGDWIDDAFERLDRSMALE